MRTAMAREQWRPRSATRPVPRRHVPREPDWFIRFNVSQRAQHAALVAGFVVLVVSGLPQKYPDWPLATWTINRLGGIDNARLLHRAFAVILIGQAFYHVLEIGVSALRGHLRPAMVPGLKDFFDALTMLRYSLGLAPARPKFDRYGYRQKFEYWGVIFGTSTMIATGLILWFPTVFTEVFTGELVVAAREAHGGEAALALLAIVTWHLYSVLLSPGQFPADLSIFTGRITRHRMEEEYPLELARLRAAAKRRKPAAAEPSPEARRRFLLWRWPRGPRGGGRRGLR